VTLDREQLKNSFDSDAKGYHHGRHTYPPEIIKMVAARHSSLVRVIEVGCGSGQATDDLLPYCSELTALDISESLLSIVRERLSEEPTVKFLHGSFEELNLPESHFDLLVSAQAFHWVNLEVGLPKAARILKDGGRMALFWTFLDFDEHDFLRGCRDIILRHAPHFELWPDSSRSRFESYADEWCEVFRGSSHFGEPTQRVVQWTLERTADQFRDWLSTLSWMRSLESDSRAALSAELEPHIKTSTNYSLPAKTLLVEVQAESSP